MLKDPFVPVRLHSVSGKTIDILRQSTAWMMQNAVLVFQNAQPGRTKATGYDVITYRNIERLEQRRGHGRRVG